MHVCTLLCGVLLLPSCRSTTEPAAAAVEPDAGPPNAATLQALIKAAEREHLHPVDASFNLHSHDLGDAEYITTLAESCAPGLGEHDTQTVVCRHHGCVDGCTSETIEITLIWGPSGWRVDQFDSSWLPDDSGCGFCEDREWRNMGE